MSAYSSNWRASVEHETYLYNFGGNGGPWAWGYTGTPYALGGLDPAPLAMPLKTEPTYKSYKNWHKMTHNNGIWVSTVLFTVQFEFKHCQLLAAEIECGAVSAGATNKAICFNSPLVSSVALLVQS